jgi:hypothetical protein
VLAELLAEAMIARTVTIRRCVECGNCQPRRGPRRCVECGSKTESAASSTTLECGHCGDVAVTSLTGIFGEDMADKCESCDIPGNVSVDGDGYVAWLESDAGRCNDKGLAPGHGFNSERSKQSENGGRP